MQLCIEKLELFHFWQIAGQQLEGRFFFFFKCVGIFVLKYLEMKERLQGAVGGRGRAKNH